MKRSTMKRSIIAAVIIIIAVIIGVAVAAKSTSGKPELVEFHRIEADVTGFHEINAAEEVEDGCIYFAGDKLVYMRNDVAVEVADNVSSLWRDGEDFYYMKEHNLYRYDLEGLKATKMAENVGEVLGKYKGDIITYYGRSICAVNDEGKRKIFSDGYYLNSALLFGNKVYGIPATNVYEYDLDTLKVKKVTKSPELSRLYDSGKDAYIITNDKLGWLDYVTYSAINESGTDKILREKARSAGTIYAAEEGMFVECAPTDEDVTSSIRLLFVENDGTKRVVDEDYTYYGMGVMDGKLLYYKNNYVYGTFDTNLTTFYFYDGEKNMEAFDLDVGSFEYITGYEYDGGIIISVSYESSEVLYNYDGETVRRIAEDEYMFAVADLDVVGDKAYIRYYTGLEDIGTAGLIVQLS